MNKTVYRVIGARRVGNHAVISWLQSNIPADKVLFLNEVTAGLRPETSFTELEYDGQHFGLDRARSKQAIEIASKAKEMDALILSYEDQVPSVALSGKPYSVGYDDKVSHNIIILREFLNWLASYYSLQNRNLGNSDWTTARVKQILNAVLTWHTSLRCSRVQEFVSRPDVHFVNYDRWFDSKDYRSDLLNRLSLPAKLLDLPDISNYGGGSSFGESGDSTKLRPNERWRQVSNDPNFKKLLQVIFLDQRLEQDLRKFCPQSRELIHQNFGL